MQKGERNMLKVLLVDDEPFIIQGLKVLIDWEQEGYMIAGTASNGKEAYDFLKKDVYYLENIISELVQDSYNFNLSKVDIIVSE